MAEQAARTETRLKGIALSRGCCVARACLFNESRHSNLPIYRVGGEGVDREVARVTRAIPIAASKLDDVRARVEREIGRAEAEIFVAQRMILEDPGLGARILAHIRERGVNAETAVVATLDTYEAKILSFDDEYMKERASDFGEVRRRLLDVLGNMHPSLQCDAAHCQKGRNRAIVAEELTATLTLDMDTGHTMGFVVERGGPNSHAAILARALGIPAVGGLPGIHRQISCGTEILINGDTGEVVLWPSEATIRETCGRGSGVIRLPVPVAPIPALQVFANINLSGETAEARAMRAEGIGLYRTEFELIAAGRLLTEDELAVRYEAVVRAMAPLPVVFRLLDVGSDKPLPAVEVPREENPAMGQRGARLLLARPDLLVPQARALARAARLMPIHVMYPMIVDADQFRLVRQAFRDATRDLAGGSVLHGVMFEVPSACLSAAEILAEADFGSIGTNDLSQYLFAMDRNNALVAGDYRPDHPVLWELLARLADAARRAGREISLCGEIAAEPDLVGRVIAIGIRRISISAKRISAIRTAAAAAAPGG